MAGKSYDYQDSKFFVPKDTIGIKTGLYTTLLLFR